MLRHERLPSAAAISLILTLISSTSALSQAAVSSSSGVGTQAGTNDTSSPVGIATAPRQRTKYEYDSLGRVIAFAEPQGPSARYELTHTGAIVRAVASGGFEAHQTFDAAGRVISIQRPSGGVTKMSRDAAGNLVSSVDPLGREYRFAYDSAGRLLAQTDPTGMVVRYAYDADGRLSERWAGDRNRVKFRFSATGKMISADDGTFPIRNTYDQADRLIRVDYPAIQKSVQYTYDARGRRSSVTDADGKQIRYEYGPDGYPASIVAPDGSRFDFAWDGSGNLTALSYPNGIIGRWTYDESGRVVSILYHRRDGSYVAGASYAYDDGGNLVARRDARDAVTWFSYDAAGQLIAEEGPGGITRYHYGPGGNRVAVDRSGTAILYRHDAADQLVQAGPEQYVYSAAGNLAVRRTPQREYKFEYDAGGRPTRATTTDGGDITYAYAATGERVSRQDGRGKIYFLYDRFALLQEFGEDLRTRASYIHGPGIDRPLAMVRGGQTYYYLAERLGTIIALADSAGRVVASYDYDAFGNPKSASSSPENPFTFTGREWDPALAIYYFRARYYDPATGRFLSPDPVRGRMRNPIELNPYPYANNNPVRYRDPLGLSSEDDWWFLHTHSDEYLRQELLEHWQNLQYYLGPGRSQRSQYEIDKFTRDLAAVEAEMAEMGMKPPRPRNIASLIVQDPMNRFSTFPSSLAAEQRRAWLDRIVAQVVTHRAPALVSQETSAAVSLLQADPDALVRERLWRLLANSPRDEPAVALAKQVVVDPEYSPRWSAFQYLREVDPATCETLVQTGLVRPDVNLLYVVADFVMLKDRRRGLAMMIDVVPLVDDHQLFEAVSLTLTMGGGEPELGELRRRERASGGRAYRLVADMLAGELQQKSGSPKKSPM